jgi:hypothetical protein
LVPTRAYAHFVLAEQLGGTVRSILSGQAAPMSNMEFYLWGRYRLARARIEQQQRR